MSAPFDRALVRLRRERAARGISGHDFLRREVAEGIAARLRAINREFEVAVDIGSAFSGTVHTDLAAAMVARCSDWRVVADEEALPFRTGAIDLVVSVLALHWVNDLPGTLSQIRHCLREDGLFIGALFGVGTLGELRDAMNAAEIEVTGGLSPHVSPFLDAMDGAALLQRAGFALPVADRETITVTYSDPIALMHELRAMGEGNALVDRQRKPMRRAVLMRAVEIYGERFAEPDGRIRATFEIVTLTGWAPHESQQKPLPRGSGKMHLGDALGRPGN